MIRHEGPISGVAASEKYVATAGYDNQVILWDAKTKTSLARGLHDHLANRCQISKDQNYLLSASSDYTARLWKLPEMHLKVVFNDHTDDVEMASLSPCGELVATTSQDGIVRVFRKTGEILHRFIGHQGSVSACAWNQDSTSLVSVGDDGTIRTWNLSTASLELMVKPEDVQTDAVVMLPSGVIYAGNDQGEVLCISQGEVTRLKIHNSGIKNLTLNQDATMAVSLSYDRTLCILNLEGGLRVQAQIQVPAMIWARACTFRGQGELIFGTFGSSYASLDLKTQTWDLSQIQGTEALNALMISRHSIYTVGDSGQVRRMERCQLESSGRPSIVVSQLESLCNFIVPFGDRVICGGHLGKIYDAHSGRELLSLDVPINKGLQVADKLILAAYSGEIIVCKTLESGALQVVTRARVLKNAVKDLCADGNLVFCGGAAADIALFDLSTSQVLDRRLNAHDNIINSCAAMGNGRFATVSRDMKLKIWKGVELESTLSTPHDHSVKCSAATPDQRFVATGSYDGKIAIYDTELKQWSVFKRLSASGLSSLTYAGDHFWASSYQGQIHKVSVPC